MRTFEVAFLYCCALSGTLSAQSKIPSRLAEEAEVLEENASRIVTEETLEQRSLMPPVRFRPRAGTRLAQATGPRLRIREVQSEFSFGSLHDSQSKNLFEYRQVLSVDGRPLQSANSALQTLAKGIQAGDDRVRKRMLEEFARTGLVDIATDYALILLAFTSHGQKEMEIVPFGQGFVGADAARSFSWRQKSALGGALEFRGPQSAHHPLQGTLWLRSADGLPLRVSAWMEYTDATDHLIRDEATVDYFLSEHGFLTPASVVHRHKVNETVVTENLYRYQPFKLFSASSSISFGDLPDIKK